MTETERILDQLERVYEGEAWHSPSVRETLEGVSAEKAAARTVPGAHSIWELAILKRAAGTNDLSSVDLIKLIRSIHHE
ncbi:MAG: hypothetical protein ABI596_05010 [Pyrinomonadaceae bacterium]